MYLRADKGFCIPYIEVLSESFSFSSKHLFNVNLYHHHKHSVREKACRLWLSGAAFIGMQDQAAYRKRLAIKAAKKWKNLVYRNRLRTLREPERVFKLFDKEADILHNSRSAGNLSRPSSDMLDLLKARPRVLESTQSHSTAQYLAHSSFQVCSPPFHYSSSKISNVSPPVPSKVESILEAESVYQRPKQFDSCIPYKCHSDIQYSRTEHKNLDGRIENSSQTWEKDSIEDIRTERYKAAKYYGLAYAAPRRPISFTSPSSLSTKPSEQSTKDNVEYSNESKIKIESNISVQNERKNILAMEIINFISEMKNSKVRS